VQTGDLALQFDAGRATSMRLASLRVTAAMLDALFITHHHSDHVQGVDDLAFSRWIVPRDLATAEFRLPVVAPDGPLRHFLNRMFDHWEDDLAVRRLHQPPGPVAEAVAAVDATLFGLSREPTEVWRRGDVRVLAGAVRHEPVVPAVGYRIESPDGTVAISGDTNACPEMEVLAQGADVLVHEAMLSDVLAGTSLEFIMDYHTDSVELGGLAQRAGVKTLMLTHIIPAPDQVERGEERFTEAVRSGGFEGELIVGTDLASVSFG
jgi:ribonuclease Z